MTPAERKRAEEAYEALLSAPPAQIIEAMHVILRDERKRMARLQFTKLPPVQFRWEGDKGLRTCFRDGARAGIAAYRKRIKETL